MRWILACIFIQLPFLTRAEDLFPYVNYSAEPCDNFYNFACGRFESVHPVPVTFTSWDEFIRLQKEIDEQLKELLKSGKSQGDSKSFVKAKRMYAGCMDSKLRDAKGVFPLRKIIKGWPYKYDDEESSKITSTDWLKMANLIANYGVQFIFKLTIRADILNATRTSIYIESDDMTLPTSLLKESVRILDNDLSSRTDSALTDYLIKIMTILKDDSKQDIDDADILKTAKGINEFMLVLSQAKALNYGEQTTTYIIPSVGSTTLSDLQSWSDEVLGNFTDPINWETYLQTALKRSGVKVDNDTQIFITNRSLLRNLLLLAHETDKKLMDDFVYSRLATYMAPELTSELYDISMDFYTLRGYVAPGYPKWKYCLHKVLDFPKIGLSFAVAKKYRDIYIKEETVERAMEMVENLREAMEELIEDADWMDDSTKNYAIYKLKNILILTGSPDYLETDIELDKYYKKLKIFRNDHFGNINRLRSFSQGKNFAELGRPRNRNLWTQSPLIVNAYYNGINNRILFPISTMIEPFFFGNATSLLDYARIGSIMAHELTHAFDSQGKLLDAEGSLTSWWSQSTKEIYANKTKCFVEQYNEYIIEGSNSTVNGEYTLPENIADNVGLRAAFRAFKNQRSKILSPISESDYFTAEQEFYLAFASIWCHVGAMASSDQHAPHKYRVLGPIQNMESFVDTWQCRGSVNDDQANGVSSEDVEKDVCILW